MKLLSGNVRGSKHHGNVSSAALSCLLPGGVNKNLNSKEEFTHDRLGVLLVGIPNGFHFRMN